MGLAMGLGWWGYAKSYHKSLKAAKPNKTTSRKRFSNSINQFLYIFLLAQDLR